MLEIMEICLLTILGLLVISLAYSGFFGFLYMGIDRKLVARMQGRVGPQIRQPFRDFLKLCGKESIVPHQAISWLYEFAPILALSSALTLMLYIPIGIAPVFAHFGDLIVILYLLTMIGIAIIVGASSSSSLFGAVGAQRAMVMIISYEVPLAVVIFGLAWRMSIAQPGIPAFSLLAFSAQNVWFLGGPLSFIGVCLLFLTALMCIPGAMRIGPFDIPEAKTEIAFGPFVEYSGRALATFSLTYAINLIAISSLTVAIFFPQGVSSFIALEGVGGVILDIIFHVVKIFIILFFTVSVVKTVTARLKITQAVQFYWFTLMSFGLLGLIFIMLDYYWVV
ncbi:MAG: NADH-quinone oxidoreductase subunit H [Euryarchaeota archaeon]|nr:NADH-quinone oxidoreductase subunit H [Euryarchaeota archaeon]